MLSTSSMGTGRLCHSRAFLSLPALSDQQRLTVNEKKGFKVTKSVGLEDIRKETKVLRQKPYVQLGNNFLIITPRVFL